MAEPTAVKEQAKLYEDQINDLKRAHKEALDLHERRHAELKQAAHDRETELKAQSDGLLGALGRINAENGDLKEKLQQTTERFERGRLEMAGQTLEAKMQIDRFQAENARILRDAEVLSEDARSEIKALKEELARAKGKK